VLGQEQASKEQREGVAGAGAGARREGFEAIAASNANAKHRKTQSRLDEATDRGKQKDEDREERNAREMGMQGSDRERGGTLTEIRAATSESLVSCRRTAFLVARSVMQRSQVESAATATATTTVAVASASCASSAFAFYFFYAFPFAK